MRNQGELKENGDASKNGDKSTHVRKKRESSFFDFEVVELAEGLETKEEFRRGGEAAEEPPSRPSAMLNWTRTGEQLAEHAGGGGTGKRFLSTYKRGSSRALIHRYRF